MDYKVTMRMYNEYGILEEIETFKQGEKQTIKFILLSLVDGGIIDSVIRIDTQAMRLVEQSIQFKDGELLITDNQGEL